MCVSTLHHLPIGGVSGVGGTTIIPLSSHLIWLPKTEEILGVEVILSVKDKTSQNLTDIQI